MNLKLKKFLRITVFIFFVFILLAAVLVGGWLWRTNRLIERSEDLAAADGAPGAIFSVDDFDLHVRLYGDPQNRPLLLIHGFDIDGGGSWGEPFLTDLADDYYVIAPDLLGFGHSERVVEPSNPITHAGQAALLVDLLDILDIEAVTVIGTSYGGGIALQMGLDYPERVELQILMAPQHQPLELPGFIRAIVNAPFGVGRVLAWYGFGANPGQRERLTAGCEEENGYCPPEEVVERRLRLARIKGTADGFYALLTTPINARIPAELDRVERPTVIIWGTEDGTIPVSNSDYLLEQIPHAELVLIEGGGHTPYFDQPIETAKLVRQILNETLSTAQTILPNIQN